MVVENTHFSVEGAFVRLLNVKRSRIAVVRALMPTKNTQIMFYLL